MSLSAGAIVGLVLGGTVTGVAAMATTGVLIVAAMTGPTESHSSTHVVVTRVIDGDTVEIDTGQRVRLIGIDTPERGKCGSIQATDALREMVEGKTVTLPNPPSVQDRDKYGRLLRYLQVGKQDAGYDQLQSGLADARYDSEDGYDPHPREARYRATAGIRVSSCEKAKHFRMREARRAAHDAGIKQRPDETAEQLLNRAHAVIRKQRAVLAARWREAKRVAKQAGLKTHRGETPGHLLNRAHTVLKHQRIEAAASKAGIRQRSGETASHLLSRAEHALEEQRHRREERAAREAASAPAPSGGDSVGGSEYSTDNDHGYTGPRCYDPGGVTFHSC